MFYMNKNEGIKINGHLGSWYVLDKTEVAGHELFLLESEQHGENAPSIIVDYNRKIIAEDVTNGWDDLPNRFEIEVKIKGYLPEFSFPGMYPIYYVNYANNPKCAKCATKEVEDIVEMAIHWEGYPMVCDECNEAIESAYGVPEEDEENEE